MYQCGLDCCCRPCAGSHPPYRLLQLSRVETRAPLVRWGGLAWLRCPPGWRLLEKSERETTIGNYIPDPDTPPNTFGGRGRAWSDFMTLPPAYKDLEAWIYAARKLAPDASEEKRTVRVAGGATATVTVFRAAAGTAVRYATFFFQVAQTPCMLELYYGVDDPKKGAYEAAMVAMIEGAEIERR